MHPPNALKLGRLYYCSAAVASVQVDTIHPCKQHHLNRVVGGHLNRVMGGHKDPLLARLQFCPGLHLRQSAETISLFALGLLPKEFVSALCQPVAAEAFGDVDEVQTCDEHQNGEKLGASLFSNKHLLLRELPAEAAASLCTTKAWNRLQAIYMFSDF